MRTSGNARPTLGRAAAAAALAVAVLTLGGISAGAEEPLPEEDVPDLVGEFLSEALDRLWEMEFTVDVSPERFVADEDVVVIIGQRSAPEDRYTFLHLGTAAPDLHGESGSDLREILRRHDLRLEVDGEFVDDWVVVYQSPSPGTLLEFGDAVLVALEPAGEGSDGAWKWIVPIAVLVVGATLVSQVRKQRPRDDGHERDDRDRDAPHRLTAKPIPGRGRVELEIPPDEPTGHAVRFETVIGTATYTIEEADV